MIDLAAAGGGVDHEQQARAGRVVHRLDQRMPVLSPSVDRVGQRAHGAEAEDVDHADAGVREGAVDAADQAHRGDGVAAEAEEVGLRRHRRGFEAEHRGEQAGDDVLGAAAVSYTHLDVYKRQG